MVPVLIPRLLPPAKVPYRFLEAVEGDIGPISLYNLRGTCCSSMRSGSREHSVFNSQQQSCHNRSAGRLVSYSTRTLF